MLPVELEHTAQRLLQCRWTGWKLASGRPLPRCRRGDTGDDTSRSLCHRRGKRDLSTLEGPRDRPETRCSTQCRREICAPRGEDVPEDLPGWATSVHCLVEGHLVPRRRPGTRLSTHSLNSAA